MGSLRISEECNDRLYLLSTLTSLLGIDVLMIKLILFAKLYCFYTIFINTKKKL